LLSAFNIEQANRNEEYRHISFPAFGQSKNEEVFLLA